RPAGRPTPRPTDAGTAPGHAGDPQPPDPGPVGQSGPDSAALERLARSNAELARGALDGQPKKKGAGVFFTSPSVGRAVVKVPAGEGVRETSRWSCRPRYNVPFGEV